MKVKAHAVIGNHDDAIVSLAFQTARNTGGKATTDTIVSSNVMDVASETAARSTGVTSAASHHGRQSRGGQYASQTEVEAADDRTRTSKDGFSRAFQDHRRPASALRTDEDRAPSSPDRDPDSIFDLLLVSACVDGTVCAWATYGTAGRKYRLGHPSGDEVTSMIVLPGGFTMVTGERRPKLRLKMTRFERSFDQRRAHLPVPALWAHRCFFSRCSLSRGSTAPTFDNIR